MYKIDSQNTQAGLIHRVVQAAGPLRISSCLPKNVSSDIQSIVNYAESAALAPYPPAAVAFGMAGKADLL